MKDRTKQIYEAATQLDCCPLFKGTEDTDKLIRLFLTKQGIEFCTDNNFPSLEVLRTFDETEKYGIYIDKEVTLTNVSKLVLIGETQATLIYDDPDKKHEVILMHGAKAKIQATGFAVVFVTNSGGIVEKETTEFAKIL